MNPAQCGLITATNPDIDSEAPQLLSPSLLHAATAAVRVRATRDAASVLNRRVMVLGMSWFPFT